MIKSFIKRKKFLKEILNNLVNGKKFLKLIFLNLLAVKIIISESKAKDKNKNLNIILKFIIFGASCFLHFSFIYYLIFYIKWYRCLIKGVARPNINTPIYVNPNKTFCSAV